MKIFIALILSLLTASLFAQQIYQTDCNSFNPWLTATAQTDVTAITAQAVWSATGTIDAPNTNAPTASLGLTVNNGSSTQNWTATLKSDFIYVENTVTNLGLLTLSFDHSVTELRPVTVQIESYDQNKNRTGGLEAQVEPAAANFYIRSAVDLSTMKPFGAGTFVPTNPYIRISFKITALPAYITPVATQTLKIDNIAYSSPKYYVKPSASNNNDGLTEQTAFATIQKAIDLAQAGDIVVVMEGTYHTGLTTTANFPRKGNPAAWIVLKNYPGQKPKLMSNAWAIVNIGKGSSTNRWTGETLAYIEVRGLHIRGEGDVVRTRFPDAVGKADGRVNTNGIGTNGYYMTNCPHHIRFADNLVEYVPGGGVGTLETDWVQMENNIVRNSCWTNIYGASNMGTLGAANFDLSNNVYKIVIRNNISSGARTYELVASSGNKISDGNGIIIDVNEFTANRPTESYRGRTLVQNNICFNNGGSGIHTVRANHVDIINNTTYLNSASPELQYSQIYAYGSRDVRFINNILVAPVANTAAGEIAEPVNRLGGTCSDIIFSNNIYFGGNIAPTLGTGDIIADPKFVNPSIDAAVADFHLQANSPAIGAGSSVYSYLPRLDFDGNLRRKNGANPSIGSNEYIVTTSITPAEKESFILYPNPTTGIITVKGLTANAQIELYDTLGKSVLSKIINSGSADINVSSISQGIYIYKISVDNKILQTGKMVKE